MSQPAPPNVETLPAMLAHTAAEHGAREVLRQAGEGLSADALAAHAAAFGDHLRGQGITRGDRLLLLVENSLEYVVALFGALGIGAVVVPINPETQAGTIGWALADCDAKGVIARERIVARLGAGTVELPRVATFGARWAANRDEFFGGEPHQALAGIVEVTHSPAPGDLALILYTSGTTGHPKGVMLTHRNLLANTRGICEYLRLTEVDSIVNVLPFYYSFGNSILLTHLAVGARIIVENRFLFPAKVVESMQEARPTGFSGVPSTFYILLNKTDFLARDWHGLRYISQAGGGMRVETIRRLREALPRETEIFVMYGQTEASARLSYLPPGELEARMGSIGRGMPGVELRVVDEHGREVAPGEVGEIVARGENVMPGYLYNPEETARALRDGWLWTGDMARRDADGYIYIVSRKADFIKTASYRVSPGEIEEVIAEVAGVEDVAVFGVEDLLLGEALVACVIAREDAFDAEAIRRHCRERLPLYKVPRHIVRVDELPRTDTGKKRYHVLREQFKRLGNTGAP